MKVSDCIYLIESAVDEFNVFVDIKQDFSLSKVYCIRLLFKHSVLLKNDIEFISYLNARFDILLSVDFNNNFYISIYVGEL